MRRILFFQIILFSIAYGVIVNQSYGSQKIPEVINKLNSLTEPQQRLEFIDEALQDDSTKGNIQSQLFLQRGIIYKDQGDYFKAIEDFDAALSISKRNYSALIEKAECLIMVDQLDQANLALDSYLLNMPGVARAYVLKGLIFEKEGSLIKAEDEFTRALNFDPQSALALEHRARLYVREGKPRKALDDLSVWNRINPNNPELFVFRAEIHVKLGDFDAALSDYARAGILRPDDTIRKQRILLLLKTSKPEIALAESKKIIAEKPDDVSALVLAARCFIQLDEFRLAETNLKKALKINPRLPESYLYLGVLKNGLGKHDEALEYLNQSIELEPKLVEAYKERARIFMELGDQLRAGIDLSSAATIDPSDGEIFAMRGMTYYNRLLYDAAIQDFSQVIEGFPHDSKTLYNRAVCYLKKDDLQLALSDLNQVIRIRPDSGRAFSLRGITLSLIGKIEDAISDFDKSIALSPKDPSVWNNRGFFRYRIGNLEGAVSDFNEATKLNPEFNLALTNLNLASERLFSNIDINSVVQEAQRANLN